MLKSPLDDVVKEETDMGSFMEINDYDYNFDYGMEDDYGDYEEDYFEPEVELDYHPKTKKVVKNVVFRSSQPKTGMPKKKYNVSYKTFQCLFRDCEETLNRNNHYEHLQEKHDAHLTCEICEAQMPDVFLALEHQAKIHGNMMKCKICDKDYLCYKGFMRHCKTHSAPTKICDICGKGLKSESSYKAHMLNMHTEKNLKCDKCEYRTALIGNLNMHLQSHEEAIRICDICGMTFKTQSGE